MTNHMRTTVLRSVLAVLAVYLWGVTLSDRADAAVIPKSVHVSGETWTGGDTYHVTGDLTVNDGTTLTVQTGAVVKFDPNLQLKVFGKLDGDGISENPVIFTSRDDDILGEVVPASDGVPAPGDWFGIWLEGSGVNDGIGELEFVTSDMVAMPRVVSMRICISTNRIPGISPTASANSAPRMACRFLTVHRRLITVCPPTTRITVYSPLEAMRRLRSPTIPL